MVCSFCQRRMTATALFCDHCGRLLPVTGATRPLAPDQGDAATPTIAPTYDPDEVQWLIDGMLEAIEVLKIIRPYTPESIDRLCDAILAAYTADGEPIRPPRDPA